MNLLDIGFLSEMSGVPASTLRYYEELGLIESLGRHGLRRQFGPEALTQLAFISLGKTAGFSLEEIKSVFGREGIGALPRDALQRRADDIDAQIRRLTTLRNALRHIAECSAPSHMECPKFRRLLRLAPHMPASSGKTLEPKTVSGSRKVGTKKRAARAALSV